jgi:hypothetical protein
MIFERARAKPLHPVIVETLKALVGQGVRLCYTSQTLAEFWNASTRPLDKNGSASASQRRTASRA